MGIRCHAAAAKERSNGTLYDLVANGDIWGQPLCQSAARLSRFCNWSVHRSVVLGIGMGLSSTFKDYVLSDRMYLFAQVPILGLAASAHDPGRHRRSPGTTSSSPRQFWCRLSLNYTVRPAERSLALYRGGAGVPALAGSSC